MFLNTDIAANALIDGLGLCNTCVYVSLYMYTHTHTNTDHINWISKKMKEKYNSLFKEDCLWNQTFGEFCMYKCIVAMHPACFRDDCLVYFFHYLNSVFHERQNHEAFHIIFLFSFYLEVRILQCIYIIKKSLQFTYKLSL